MNKKEKMELIVTGVGMLILIIYLVNMFTKPKEEVPSVPSEIELIMTEEIEPISLGGVKPKKEWEEMTWGRDPFGLGVKVEEEEVSELVLGGIIWDKQNPYAIINDEVVNIGDMIKGYTVVKITPDSVVLESGGEQITLNMWQ